MHISSVKLELTFDSKDVWMQHNFQLQKSQQSMS